MGYFRELPELDYQSFLSDSNSSSNYLRVKNLFRRCKLRDDLQSIFTLFNKYEIVEGARPDTVAEELYGDAELDWVVLMTAGIINGRLILPKGKVVDSTFKIPDPDTYTATISPIDGISNYEYEVRKNDAKRSIFLLKESYLQQFLNDMREEMIYSRSSEYVNENLVRTENTRITSS